MDYLQEMKSYQSSKNLAHFQILGCIGKQYTLMEGGLINQRNKTFETFIPIQPDKKYNLKSHSF